MSTQLQPKTFIVINTNTIVQWNQKSESYTPVTKQNLESVIRYQLATLYSAHENLKRLLQE